MRKLEVLFWDTQVIYQQQGAIISVDHVISKQLVRNFGLACILDSIIEWFDVENTEYGDVLCIEDIEIVGEIKDD